MRTLLGGLLLGLMGCAGEEPVAAPAEDASVAPAALLESTWQVRLAVDATRAPFEQDQGWAQLFMREYPSSLATFAGAGSAAGQARLHLEYAGLYRQAAWLAANATRQVYGADRQETDPADVSYLLAVSQGLAGDCAAARTALGSLEPATSAGPLGPGVAAWTAWVAVEPCPSPLSMPDGAILGAPGAVAVGTLPEGGALPPLTLTERSDEKRAVPAMDPTSLYLVSRWHEAAANAATPEDDAALIAALLSPWRLPIDGPGAALPAGEIADTWLFGGFATSAGDVAFLAVAGSQGPAAVEAHKATSVLAAVLAPTIQNGAVVPDLVLDQAALFGQQVEAAMAAKAGKEEGFHRPFADIARVAVLRAGMLVADAAGQYRDAGILRINALERSTGPTGDPVFLMAVAAWDAGNRNPQRAQDLIHSLTGRFPGVDAARYPLDAMHIRLARNAGPATPVH